MARSEDKFKLLREHDKDKDKKLAPQSKVIYDIIAGSDVNKDMVRSDLITALTKSAEDGTLKTRQQPTRVLAFYQSQLVKAGLLEIILAPSPKSKKTNK